MAMIIDIVVVALLHQHSMKLCAYALLLTLNCALLLPAELTYVVLRLMVIFSDGEQGNYDDIKCYYLCR